MDRGLYQGQSNVPYQKDIAFKLFLDAGNAPTLAGWASTSANTSGNPLNLYIVSATRVSQGLYRFTLNDAFKNHVRTTVDLNVNAAGVARWAQPGPVTITTGTAPTTTFDVFIVDNAGAVQDPPAANANNYISGVITFCDIASV